MTNFLRSVARRLPLRLKRPLRRLAETISTVFGDTKRGDYAAWVAAFDTLSPADQHAIVAHISRLEYKPLISVVMPVYETPEWALREAIESIRSQLYPHWELCIADDASKDPRVATTLREMAAAETRIKWISREQNGHISAASNSALSIATGEFVALMDHDDLLPRHALYEVAVALNKNPDLDIIYSDEDQIDRNGKRSRPYFKTDWNVDLLLGHNMINHLGVYRRSLVNRVGGFREGFEGSQDYDLALRCADESDPSRICHIPSVLYHWRRDYGAASFSEEFLARCSDSALRAIREHLDRRNEAGEAMPHPALPQWSRVVCRVPEPAPLVSLIVPTRDRADLLRTCVEGLLNRTSYREIEVLIVDHESKLPETLQLFETLKRDERVRVIPYSGAFNYSAINNMAVRAARGSIIGLINNDIDVINEDWLSEMVSLAVRENVGAVGAKLLYPNEQVQHGGIVLGVGGVANHFNHALPRGKAGYFGRNLLTSSVSAVTGACLIVRKSAYDEVGGLNETDLPVAFNDVDFCLKLKKKGYRNIWTPHAELYHNESASRGTDNTPEKSARFRSEANYMRTHWGPALEHDPFYNDNFSTEIGRGFELAFPPRLQKSWIQTNKHKPVDL